MNTEPVKQLLLDSDQHDWSQYFDDPPNPNIKHYIKSYIKSYPNLREAAEQLYECMGEDALIAIAHIAYGWMPTILKNVEKIEDVAKKDVAKIEVEKFCERVVNTSSFAEAREIISELEESPINNSWVGLSKTLHFMNPEFFPIWDSNVAKHFEVGNQYQMSKQENYTTYIQFIKDQQEAEVVSVVQQLFEEKENYKVTKTRACEFALFCLSQNT